MRIEDLDKLRVSSENNSMFDITETIWNIPFGKVLVHDYAVSPEQEMRIDLVCDAIYGNTDYVDFLLRLNNIINPMNIQSGMIIKFVPIEQIISYKKSIENKEELRSKFINNNKRKREDKKRKKYIEKVSLPITVTQAPIESVKYNENTGNITIGEGLFGV